MLWSFSRYSEKKIKKVDNQFRNGSSNLGSGQNTQAPPPTPAGVQPIIPDTQFSPKPQTPTTPQQVQTIIQPPRQKRHLSPKARIILIALLIVLLLIGGGIAVSLLVRPKQQADTVELLANRYNTVQIPLNDLLSSGDVSLLGTRNLAINGPLKVNDNFIISPSGQPSNATAGQIYFDQNSNELAYFNGTAFVPLPGPVVTGDGITNVNNTITNAGVLSLQGQTGAVTLTAGSGIAVDGTTLSNTGVTTLGDATGAVSVGSGLAITNNTLTNTGVNSLAAGTLNLIITNDGSGNLTISDVGGGSGTVQSPGGTNGRIAKFTGVQTIADSLLSESGTIVTVDDDLVVTDDLTVNGSVTLAAPLGVSNGGTGATALTTNGVVIGQGAGALTVVSAGGAGLCFQSTAGAPTFAACPGGVTSVNGLSGVLTIANATGVGTTITIDDASTTQKGIAQFNATNFSGTGTINTIQNIHTGATPTFAGVNTNTITPSAALTVGSNTQQFTLQGNGSSVINATSGVNATTLSFQAPTANVTYRFATATAGTYDVCTMVGNCAGVGGGVTTSGGTINTLPKFTGAQALGDSLISELGGTITVAGNLNITTGNQYQINGTQISSANLSNDSNLAKLNASQTFTGNTNAFVNGSNSTTAFSIQNAATNRVLTIDTSGGEAELGQGSTLAGRLVFNNATNNNTITLVSSVATGARIITLPDDTGTICLSTGNCAGAGATLQTAYNNSTSPEITLDATRGALTIRDNATPIAANLLEVQNNAGSTTYLAVTTSGVSVTGTTTSSGNINSSGGTLQTGGTTRIDNTGNATNIGNIGLNGAISGGTTYSGSGNINTTAGALQTNSTTRVDASGNLTNIGNITATGATTIASSGAGNDITINGADEFIVQDAAVFNGLATFSTDVDLALADTENLSITNTVTGTNALNLLGVVLTNNTSSGTQNIALLQNAAGSGTTDGLLILDNADTDTAVTSGLQITSAAGGVGTALDVSDADITTALLFGLNDITGTNFSVTGATGSFTSAGNGTLQGGTVTVGTSSVAGSLVVHDGSTNTGTIQVAALGQNTVYTLPDPGGANVDICLSSGNCSGAAVTLQSAYNNSTSPEITLDATRGAVTIRDNATPIAANLFEVQNNGGGTTYLAVTSSGISVTGTTTSSGNINSSGGALQTGGTDRISNGGNLINIGTLSLSGAISGGTTYSGSGNINTSTGAIQTAGTDRISSGGNLVNIGSLSLSGGISGGTTYSGSGNINTSGGALQTAGTTRVENDGNLVNIGNITGAGAITVASSGAGNDITIDGADQFIVQDAAVLNAIVTFNADVDLAFADTENLSITNTVTGTNSVNLIGAVLTNNTSSGTQQVALLQNASGSGTTEGLLILDNADTDTAVTNGVQITSAAGGIGTALDVSDADITTALLFGLNDITGTNFSVTGATGSFTSAGNATIQGGTVTVGTTSQAASLVMHDGNGQTATIAVADLAGDRSLTIPAATGPDTFCLLSLANCVGTGGGVSGSGSANRLSKFTGAGSVIGDSTITDNGTSVTTTVDVVVQGGDLTVGTTSQLASLLLHDGDGQTTTLQAGNSGGNLTFILPTTAGSATQCLKQSGTGNQLIWQDCDGGGGGSSATLQTAYNNGANITTTDARDIDIVLANTTTDANFDLVVADGSTSFVSFTRADGAGTADPAQMLLVDNLDTNRALPIGIKLQAAGGGMTVAIDATDAEIVDALSVAANNIVGTTGNIDLSNFDVVGASGDITTAGDLDVNGGNIDSSGALAIANGSGNLSLNSAGTIELQDNTNITGNLDASGTLTAGTADAFQVAATGEITSASNATLQGGTITVGTASQGGTVVIYDGSTHRGSFVTAALSDHRTYTLPDDTGTVCLSTGNCAGAGVTLQTAYNNSTSPEITLDATRGALTIRDNASTVTTLLEVQNSAGGTTYFGVSTSGVSVSGTATVTGTINSSGGAIQTGGTDRISNGGNLVNVGNITGTGAITIASSGAGNDIIINGADILDVQDAATFAGTTTFNGAATFNTDVNLVLADTENFDITNTVTGTNDLGLFSVSLTNNTTSGWQVVGSLTNEDGTGDTDVLLELDHADPDNELLFGLLIDSHTGGIATAIDASASNIDTALNVGGNTIQGTVGDITFDEFSITGATGDIATNGDLDVNGGNIDSTGTLTIANASGNLTLNTAGTIELQDTTNVTGALSTTTTITVGSLGSAGATALCRNASNQIATCNSNPASVTLQQAYDAGSTIATTDARDIAITLANTATDSNFAISIADDSTGTVSISRANGAGTNNPTQLLLLDNLDTNQAVANGIIIQSAAGAITDGLDVSDAELVNAVNIGANTILGTTGDIDLTNFDVTGSNGNITTLGDIGVHGGDITSAGALRVASGSTLLLENNSGNINVNSFGTIELQDATNVTGTLSTTTTITVGALGSAGATALCRNASNQIATCSGGGGSLQGAYDTGNTITTTDARDIAITLANTTTDSNFTITIADDSTSSVNITRANGAGTNNPSQLVLIENLDTNQAVAAGLVVRSAAGAITTGIDASDSDLGVALAAGGNTITGTNFTIDGNNGTLTLQGTGTTTFTTPVGSNLATKIGIPGYAVGVDSQVIALGLTSGADATARGISLFDARTGAHQPTLAVFNPDESSAVGFTWNGDNNTATIQTNNTSATTKDLTIRTGTGTGANTSTGGIGIDVGAKTGSGTNGAITIGGANASGINIGYTSGATNVTTTVRGLAVVRPRTDNANVFQVQDAGGTTFVSVDSTTANLVLGKESVATGRLQFEGATGTNSIILTGQSNPGGNRTITLPDATGIVCLDTGNCSTSLQGAYTGSSSPATITTTSGKDLSFVMTDAATDPNFLIDLQCDTSCSTNGRFAIQDDAVDILTVLPAGGGITVGEDSLNTALSFESGTGAINMGTGAQARTVNLGTGAADQDVSMGSTSSGSSLTLNAGTGNAVLNATAGTVTLQTTTSGAINIKPVSADGTNIVLGTAADNIGTLLVLDEKNGSGDPTGAAGGMYYNSAMAVMRCYADGRWTNCNRNDSDSWGYNFEEDFWVEPTSDVYYGEKRFEGADSGTTGANVVRVALDVGNRPGQVQLETGTNAAGWANLFHVTPGGSGEWTVIGGGEELEFAVNIPTLADGTNDYDLRIGLCDTTNTDCDDGVYFEYDRDTSVNWRYATAADGAGVGGRTKNSSTKAVATGWTTFKAVANSAGTSITFYVKGDGETTWTNLGTNSANIPNTVANASEPAFTIQKEAGTTNRLIKIDYFHLRANLTNQR